MTTVTAPENYLIPNVSLGPLIGLAIHLFLGFLAVLAWLFGRGLGYLTRLFLFFMAVSFMFLAQVVMGLQLSEGMTIWGGRLAMLSLAWVPVGLLSFSDFLDNRPPGRLFRGLVAFAALASLVSLTVSHPFVITGPLTFQNVSGLYLPTPSPARTILFSINVVIFAVCFWRAWRRPDQEAHQISAGKVFAFGLMLWLAGAIHDRLYYIGYHSPIGMPIAWLSQILFSACLMVAFFGRQFELNDILLENTRQLAESRNLALMGRITAQVAHQVGGFLNKVVFGINIIRADRIDENSAATLATLEMNTLALSDFMRRLLTFARGPKRDPVRLSLNQAIEKALEDSAALSRRMDAAMEASMDDDMEMTGDWNLLIQAFTEIIRCGLDNLGRLPEGNRRLKIAMSRLAGDQAGITFRDNGPIIPPERLAQALVPFSGGPNDQLSMGLPLAQSIVAAHKGQLNLTSSAESGNAVEVRLPLAPVTGREALP